MFQEACLSCGTLLDNDGQIYCSEECAAAASPSTSLSSSALSSPQMDSITGGEVPALVPSALGPGLLSRYQNRDRYSVSSSSASSVSWSLLTDEEEDLEVGVEDESSLHQGGVEAHPSSIYEAKAKLLSSTTATSNKSSALSYARRPSATNHRSTVPLLHRRTSSCSSTGLSPGYPRSVPSLPLSEDDSHSVAGSDSRESSYLSERDREQENSNSTVSSKPKRSRNRASLPAYFSLLQMSSPQRPSSSHPTHASPSSPPPTPKLALAASPVTGTCKVKVLMSASSGFPSATLEATPRGRRHEANNSRSRRSQSRSRSRSRSRNPTLHRPDLMLEPEFRGRRTRMDSRSSVEKVFDWTNVPTVSRGRPTVRRNSSPLPKMLLSRRDFDVDNISSVFSGSDSRMRAGGNKTRGRMAPSELDGGFSADAPGYGNGRSGLLNREREGLGRNAYGLR